MAVPVLIGLNTGVEWGCTQLSNHNPARSWKGSLGRKSLAFVAIWLLGYAGFEMTCPGLQVDDSLYRALQMFAFNYQTDVACLGSENWLMRITRFAAGLFSIYAILSLASQRFGDWVRQILQLGRERNVLLGYGRVNRILAQELLKQNKALTIVDLSFAPGDAHQVRAAGMCPVECDLNDVDALRSLNLKKVQRVYVACGDDAANLKIGSLALHCMQDKRKGAADDRPVHVHIASPKFMQELGDAADVSIAIDDGLDFFCIKKATARALVSRARLVERAADLKAPRPHVVMLGCSELAESIFLEALNATVSNEKSARFTFIDCDQSFENQLRAHYPQLLNDSLPVAARPDISFLTRDIAALNFDDDPDLKKLDDSDEPPTCWIIACREDEPNIEAALRLETAMHNLRRRPVPVFARVWQGDLALRRQAKLGGSIFFGHQNDPLVAEFLLEEGRDWFAKRIHAGYLEDLGVAGPGKKVALDTRPYDREWEHLPVSLRNTNRLVADHVPQKLWDLGFEWRQRDTGRIPLAPRDDEKSRPLKNKLDFIRNAKREEELPHELMGIARTEHLRWMLDRAVFGIKHGTTRSNRQRIHPEMVDFDTLQKVRKRLDLTAIREALLLPDSEAPRKRAGRAIERVVFSTDIEDAATAELPDGVTELAVHLRDGRSAYTSKHKKELAALIRKFAKKDTACRLHFVIIGEGLIGVRTDTGETVDSSRFLKRWLSEAIGTIPEEVFVDLTWRRS